MLFKAPYNAQFFGEIVQAVQERGCLPEQNAVITLVEQDSVKGYSR